MSNKRKKRRRMSGHEQANKGNNPTKTVQTDGPEAQLSVAQQTKQMQRPKIIVLWVIEHKAAGIKLACI
jgi:hypothetical protein